MMSHVTKFAGMSFTEPMASVAITGIARMTTIIGQRMFLIPSERRWLLRAPLRELVRHATGLALRAQDRERWRAHVKQECLDEIDRLSNTDLSSMTDQEFEGRLSVINKWECDAEIDLAESRYHLMVAMEAIVLLLATAIHDRPEPLPYELQSVEMRSVEAAHVLGCSQRHVQRLAKSGEIPARMHPDGSWRYKIQVAGEPMSWRWIKAWAHEFNSRRSR